MTRLLGDAPEACDSQSWDWKLFQIWLAARGLQALDLKLGEQFNFAPVTCKTPIILSGKSPRNAGDHSVTGYLTNDGFVYDYDPHPDRTFLDGDPTHVTFLVKL